MTVIAEWAKFLERVNGPIPHLMSKIEAPDKKRGSLYKYYRLLSKYESCCFYCQTMLEKRYTHVDHFLPWSYLFENELWNLVLACQRCNLKKRNNVASEEFKDCLIHRNKKYYDVINELQLSLERLDRRDGWVPEINNHYKTCLIIEPGRISLP
ncbi:MAG: HNH endonuclease [Thaumarchaeota archaeon]|nr:HNH endonuclease [Nitrososphaerota archaeon]